MDLSRNQKGQIIVEAVLLLVLTFGIMMLFVGQLKKMEFAKKVTIEPWARISGMVECGSWSPCGRGAGPGSQAHHPSNRIVSYRPD